MFDRELLYRAERIGKLSSMLAWFWGKSQTYCEFLEQAAPLCEIGAILASTAIPPIQDGAKGAYSFQRHAQIASHLLQGAGTPQLKTAQDIVSALGERFDGKGLPQGLHGAGIPSEAHIVALVARFDSMACDETRHIATSTNPVCRYFRYEAGRSFDPILVNILLKEWAAFMAIREAINRTPHVQLLSHYGGDGVVGLRETLSSIMRPQ